MDYYEEREGGRTFWQYTNEKMNVIVFEVWDAADRSKSLYQKSKTQ